MFRFGFVLVTTLLVQSVIHAQLPDSISLQIKNIPQKEDKVKFLLDYSDKALRTNSELHYALVREAQRIAQDLNEPGLLAMSEKRIAMNVQYQNQLDSARSLYLQILTKRGNDLDSSFIAEVYSEIGATYYYEANDKMALESWIKCFRIAEAVNNQALLARITNNIGATYGYLEDYKNAIYYINKAIGYKWQLGDTAALGSSYHNMGIYISELFSYDSARYFFKKSIVIKQKYDDQKGLAKTYNSLAVLYDNERKYDSALYMNTKALELDLAVGDSIAYSIDLGNRAEYYLKLGRYKDGISPAEQSIKLLKNVNAKSDMYKILAQLYEGNGQYKEASENWSKYAYLNDSIVSAEQEQSLQELQVKFDTELKETEIAKLESENEIQRLQQERDKQFRLLLVAVLAAVIIIALLLYRSYKKENASKKVLDTQNQELKELNFTKDRLFSIISHDLKSPLSSFHTITKSLTDNWERLEKEQLKSFVENLRDSSKEVHDMMDNLLRWALNQTGQLNYNPTELQVSAVLEDISNQLSVAAEANKITINRMFSSEVKLKADLDYLKIITRNILSNAIKFSNMGESIDILVEENEKESRISIKDRGVGMNSEQVKIILGETTSVHDIKNSDKKGTGLGITLSKELLNKMGGKLEVESEENKGTTFRLIFPKAA
ncbi:tetratricopeptide repeat-containing sensor histidine kinase [Fulvivirga lutea]|uniref:histidine kinase n=1 Tax=Fulvivirga lutea TaxID=2810512 RepID=A0A974WHQ0_9BACT|nr:tetratricopeptide repeat-containing sensor histidine kinase [Fulvivirga lutea]QSE97432.1 tetratricopeptide repeat-containing sensor histidine kinase [Fulvivirga lutea]